MAAADPGGDPTGPTTGDHISVLTSLLSLQPTSATRSTATSGSGGGAGEGGAGAASRKNSKAAARRAKRAGAAKKTTSTSTSSSTAVLAPPRDSATSTVEYERLAMQVSEEAGPGSSTVLARAAEEVMLGWDTARNAGLLQFSADALRVWRNPAAATADCFSGAVGVREYTSGRHAFAVRVSQPVDDAFWVGVAYPDCRLDVNPKRNERCIVWAGGSKANDRPGTLRVHAEKFRNQPMYRDGDVIGVVVDLGQRDLELFLNGHRVMEWRGVLKGPVVPFVSFRHCDGPAATLLQHWEHGPDPSSNGGAAQQGQHHRDVIGARALPAVDGSVLEGGGQVLRVSLALGALLGRPLHIHSIRAGRSKPGLGHQHSTGAKLVCDLSRGLVKPEAIQYGGHCPGATELRFWPGVDGLCGGAFSADTHTAGAVTLLLQAALPCALLGNHAEAVRLRLRGGTNVPFSPPADYLRLVLFPLLQRFGIPPHALHANVVRRGYYPLGGGQLDVMVAPVPGLTGIDLTERGGPVAVRGVVYSGGTVSRTALKEAVRAARRLLHARFGHDLPIDIAVANEPEGSGPVDNGTATATATATATTPAPPSAARPAAGGDATHVSFKERRAASQARKQARAGTCGCQLVLETSTGCLISGNALQESTQSGEISGERVAAAAVGSLLEAWDAGGCLDEYTMDQLVVFMALAEGHSKVLCPGATSITSLHLETAIFIAELLCGTKFTRTPVAPAVEGGPDRELVECDGIAFHAVA